MLFIASMLSNISNYAFQVVMGRLLTPVEYGFMNALLSLFVVMAIPVSTLMMVVTRKTSESKAKNDFAAISSLYRFTNTRVLFSGLIGLAVFILCASSIRDYLHASSILPIIILGIAIFTTLANPVNMAVLQGVQDYKWMGINQGLGGPAKFLFTALFVVTGFGVNGVMTGMIATSLLLWGVSYYPIRNFVMNRNRKAVPISRISFSEVLPVFFAVFSFAVLTQADMVLVRHYFSAHDAGIYASAAILGKAVMYIPGAIVLAMFPMVSEKYALNQSSRHLLVKSMIFTLAISGFGTVLFYLFPGWIIRIFYGTQYFDAHHILKYYGIAMLPMALLMVLMNYLVAREKSLFSCLMIIGACLEIMTIFYFHSSPMQIVFIMLAIGTFSLIGSVALQYIPNVQRTAPVREAHMK